MGEKTAVVLCPGRGSYTADDLGYLAQEAPEEVRARLGTAIDRSDGLRTARGDLTIREMDGARKFKSDLLRGENAAGLIFACTSFDALRLDRSDLDIIAVGGNSLGWYSALFVSGVFDLDDAFDLVETMGGMARDGQIGGQIIYPVVGDDWRLDTERSEAVEAALVQAVKSGHAAGHSIHYGGFAVLWTDEAGTPSLADNLPKVKLGSRQYPLELAGHSAFHSRLMAAIAERAMDQLEGLPWRPPRVSLIDGRGAQWRPVTTDPDELIRYTLGHQVLNTFDFTATVRVALREYAPDCMVLLGPGDALGAAVAQVMIEERWQGIDNREAFLERQESDPFLVSMAREEQAKLVTASAA